MLVLLSLVYPDSWLEASSGILPQLEHCIVAEENFAEELAHTVVSVEEDWEILEVVDLRTEFLLERWHFVESLLELKLHEFFLSQDV